MSDGAVICNHWREYTEFPGRAIGWVSALAESDGVLALALDGSDRTFTIPVGAELWINGHTFPLANLLGWWADESPPDGSDTAQNHTRLAADLECDEAGAVTRAMLYTRA